jgi:hypothetical protein
MRRNVIPTLLFIFVLLLSVLLPGRAMVARAAPAEPDAVVAWNAIAQRAVIQVGGRSPADAFIHLAYVQAAVYDAVVAIEGRYAPYALNLGDRAGASVDAAVAAAAHGVLLHYFPAQQDALNADLTSALAAIPDGPAKTEGIAVGQEAAAGIIALRQGDGLGADIGFVMPPPGPGVWQLPPGQAPLTPWVAKMIPFTLERPDQFRSGPPPALTSKLWAAEFREVAEVGRSNSPVRTAEQTDIARFWSTNPPAQFNTAYGQITADWDLDAVQAARLYAMGNMIGADALIACWDAKYTHLFWRPFSAIPQGETDGNPNTIGDPGWTALLPAPPHPEYPSAHGCATTAQARVFAHFLHTEQIGVTLTSTVPGLMQPERLYVTREAMVQEMTNARVWGGIHYRASVKKGSVIGEKVARWALDRYFLPVD